MAAGRPTEFNEKYIKNAKKFCRNGTCVHLKTLTPNFSELGSILGVSRETVRFWAVETEGKEDRFKPEFAAAIKEGIAFFAKKLPAIKKAAFDVLVDRGTKNLEFESTKTVEEKIIKVNPDTGEEKEEETKKVKTEVSTTTMAADPKIAEKLYNLLSDDEDKIVDVQRRKVEHSGEIKMSPLEKLAQEIDGSGQQLPGDEVEDDSLVEEEA